MDLMDLLGDPAYRHMLLNHVPIVGMIIALLVLLAGTILRQSVLLFTGLILVAVTAGSVLPIVQYGDAAYPAIFDTLDGHGRAWLDYHAYLAETWLPLFYANAALAVGALFVGVLRRPLLPWLAGLVIVVTLASIVGTSIVAKAGGSIKHPEFRLTDPPVVPSSD
jgi:hypothetical protein